MEIIYRMLAFQFFFLLFFRAGGGGVFFSPCGLAIERKAGGVMGLKKRLFFNISF